MSLSKEEKQKIVLENTPLVKKVASKIFFKLPKDSAIEFDELVNTGIIGLIKAIDRYDKEKAKFSTYAYIKIRGEILDYLRSLHIVPRTIRDKIKKEQEKNPQKAIPLSNLAIMLSIDKALANEDSSFRIKDNLIDRSKSPEEEAINSEVRDILEVAIEELKDSEKRVIQMFYFEEKELKEIALFLNISVSRVSQLKSKALFKIKQVIEGGIEE